MFRYAFLLAAFVTAACASSESSVLDGPARSDGSLPRTDAAPPTSDVAPSGNDSATPLDASPGTCGNSAREAGETCDDANAAGGDGCSATCQAEPLYVCTGAGPSSCVLAPAAWAQEAYVKASNTGAGDLFGRDVALSSDGSTLAVGAWREASSATGVGGNQTSNSAADSGAVYVFRRVGAAWTQEAYLKASNNEQYHKFGASVALSSDGSTLAVGAPGEASSATGVGGSQVRGNTGTSGAVYVFGRTAATWSQEHYIKASNTGAGDSFGASIALSSDGNTLAVGAPGEASATTGVGGNQADDSAERAGAVYVFRRVGVAWSQEAYIKASNTGAYDAFGGSVAFSSDGNTLAVGAAWEDSAVSGVGGNQADNSAINSGAVYVFRHTGANWSQDAYIKASNTEERDNFGDSIALSSDGNTLAVGADDEDSSATGVGGNQTNNGAPASGAVYVFRRTGVAWSQEAYVKASNTGQSDYFGEGIALSSDGNTLVVGAREEDSPATGVGGNQANSSASVSSGAVYVFRRTGVVWSQEAYIKSSNTGRSDYFGRGVALSSDGSTLAVGATGEGSSATGIGGNQADDGAADAGAVYVFNR